MAKKKRSKTKEYYRKTTTLKRTGINQENRNAMVDLCAEGSYQPHRFCEIAKELKFKSCDSFKKQVQAKKRRTAIEKRARDRVLDKMEFWWDE